MHSSSPQLPLCDDNGRSQGLCDIDPSKLLLEHVSQQFHGNFSCQGNNGAGWSRVSRERELQIYCEYEKRLPECKSLSLCFPSPSIEREPFIC